MGTKGREIVGVDIKELIEMLNKAYADEFLAYYQYWVGAKVAYGLMRGVVAQELEEHAQDELKHAGMLAERIISLGGQPLTNPQDWFKCTNCGYDEPKDGNVKKLLDQNIKGEQCAIMVYKKLADFVKDKDPVTYNMVLDILEDEIEHEDDLENIKEDMQKC